MKKIIYIMILLTVIACDDFLDVNPKSIVVNDDLFENDEGFQDALYGIYSSLTNEDLYGQRISYEYPELCAQLFEASSSNLSRVDASRCDFKDSKATKYIKDVWVKMYEVIGYINNLLLNIEKKSPKDLRHYNLYKGEALALRAATHFDLVKYFAVDINSDDENAKKRGIPYVVSYNYAITKFLSVEEVYNNIIKDLKEAEKLMTEDETLISYPRVPGGSTFTDARITHMNLYAVQALLARVYWHKKDMDDAAIYAKKVIDSKKFGFVEKTSLESSFASIMSLEETIWGLYSRNICSKSIKTFMNRTDKLYVDKNYKDHYEVAEVYGRDYRMDWFGLDDFNDVALIKLYNRDAYEDNEHYDDSKGYMGVNMIRIPEMYYIMAESLLDKDIDEATRYFDVVLEARGLVGLSARNDGTKLTKELIMQERRKEFIGEGLEWHRMKRENEDILLITSQKIISASDALYLWPYHGAEDEMNY